MAKPSTTKKYTRPSLTQIARGMHFSLQNAEDLLYEAEILHRNGRFARAFALCVLSLEEVGKVMTLPRGGYISPKDQRRLKSFWKNFRSHTHKFGDSRLWQTARWLSSSGKQASALPKDFIRIHLLQEVLVDRLKQLALYVDFVGGRFTLPEHVFLDPSIMQKELFHSVRDLISHFRALNPSEGQTLLTLRKLSRSFARLGFLSAQHGDLGALSVLSASMGEWAKALDETKLTDPRHIEFRRIVIAITDIVKLTLGRLQTVPWKPGTTNHRSRASTKVEQLGE